MVVQLLRHIHEMYSAADKLSLLETAKTVAIIADAIYVNGDSDMIGMETKRRRQRNRFGILHVPFVNDGIARLNIRRNPEFRYAVYCREVDIRERNGPPIAEPYHKVNRVMPAHPVKADH